MEVLVIVAVLALFAIIVLARAIRIIPQARAGVVERLGRYQRTLGPGLSILVPFIDTVRYRIDLREQVVSFPPQPVITEDNLVVSIDTVIYFQVTDPVRATYEISNYIQAIEQLTMTTLRNVIGGMDLEATLTSREQINKALQGVLDEATGKWGIRVNRVELKGIDPPPSIQDSMEKQMRADRDKRAAVLTAEGVRQSAILTAEGEKQSAILKAEGGREAQILAAQAEREAEILKAQGEAQAISTVFGAIHRGRPTQALLSYQYLQMLPQVAQGDANKVWIVPSELGKALEGLGGIANQLTGGAAAGTDAKSIEEEAARAAEAAEELAESSTSEVTARLEDRTDEAVEVARSEVAAAIAAAEAAAAGPGSGGSRKRRSDEPDAQPGDASPAEATPAPSDPPPEQAAGGGQPPQYGASPQGYPPNQPPPNQPPYGQGPAGGSHREQG